MIEILTSLKSQIEGVRDLIESGEVCGEEYNLFMFTEQKEVIEDLLMDIRDGIAVAREKQRSA